MPTPRGVGITGSVGRAGGAVGGYAFGLRPWLAALPLRVRRLRARLLMWPLLRMTGSMFSQPGWHPRRGPIPPVGGAGLAPVPALADTLYGQGSGAQRAGADVTWATWGKLTHIASPA